MKLLQLIVFIGISLSSIQSSLADDVLTLANGMSFQGEVKRIKDCYIVFKANREKYVIPSDSIYSIAFHEPDNNKVYQDYVNNAATNKCLTGQLDAEQFHGKKAAHFFYGLLFGPVALLVTALSEPTPYSGKNTALLSSNKELFTDYEYLECYKKKARGKLLTMEAIGWGSIILLSILL